MLTPFVEPLAWAAGISSNIASYFGWSTPNNLAPVDRTKIDPAFGWSNVDGARMPHKLSMSMESGTTIYPHLSLGDEDELAFEGIINRYSYFTTASWDTTNVAGNILGEFPLGPGQFYKTLTDNSCSLIQHTPLSFVASYFQYWKVDIRFRIKIVKTEFHSGRLMFAYAPSDPYTSAPATALENSSYLDRMIVDIREGNEIEFVCPYRAITPFLQAGQKFGVMSIFVVDPLVAPATVSSTIKLLIEVSGINGNFQILDRAWKIPVIATAFQSGNSIKVVEKTIVSDNMAQPTAQVVGINESCIGEKVLSFRQMMKRYQRMPFTGTNNGKRFTSGPFAATWMPPADSVTPATVPDGVNHLYSMLAGIFCFYKGGMRVALEVESSATQTWNMFLTEATAVPDLAMSFTALSQSADNFNQLYSTYSLATSKFVELEVPQYNFAYARPCAAVMTTIGGNGVGTFGQQGLESFNNVLKIESEVLTAETPIVPYRACADDGHFSTFVSIPYVIRNDNLMVL